MTGIVRPVRVLLSVAGVVLTFLHVNAFPVLGSDDPIRALAETTVLPVYPEVAIRKDQTGVVVAGIEIGDDHRVRTVDVLEAPSPEIASAVKTALLQWRFRPPVAESGKPDLSVARLRGKVVSSEWWKSTKDHDPA